MLFLLGAGLPEPRALSLMEEKEAVAVVIQKHCKEGRLKKT
nr:MAG TPA: hypothetical protein [Caudoviricetes sp.]DAE49883.1 MAG TPA: hypothetical protein [Caudoviricetes sp.]